MQHHVYSKLYCLIRNNSKKMGIPKSYTVIFNNVCDEMKRSQKRVELGRYSSLWGFPAYLITHGAIIHVEHMHVHIIHIGCYF